MPRVSITVGLVPEMTSGDRKAVCELVLNADQLQRKLKCPRRRATAVNGVDAMARQNEVGKCLSDSSPTPSRCKRVIMPKILVTHILVESDGWCDDQEKVV